MENYNLDLIANISINILYIIKFIGLIGNLLAFLVFSCKNFQNTIFYTYYRFVCIIDSLFLTLGLFQQFYSNVFVFSSFYCKIIFFLNYFPPSLSIWTMVIISIDRMCSIAFSSRFQYRKKTINQIIIIIGMIVFNLIYWSPILFVFNIDNHHNRTNQTQKLVCRPVSPAIIYLDLVNTTIIPVTLMIASTIITLKELFKSRKKSNQSTSLNKKDIKFAIISVLLIILFIIFNLPITLVNLINRIFLTSFLNEISAVAYSVASWLFYINYAHLFYINLFVNALFQKEFFNMMKKFKIKICKLFFS